MNKDIVKSSKTTNKLENKITEKGQIMGEVKKNQLSKVDELELKIQQKLFGQEYNYLDNYFMSQPELGDLVKWYDEDEDDFFAELWAQEEAEQASVDRLLTTDDEINRNTEEFIKHSGIQKKSNGAKRLYNVLIVDTDEFYDKAKEHSLNLKPMSNWEDAKSLLERGFNDFSAIILDAKSRLTKEQAEGNELFLGVAIPELERMCGERQKFIPWYILSDGNSEKLDVITQSLNILRERFNDEWGQMLYKKEAKEYEELFSNIKLVSERRPSNIILYRHRDVFKYLGKDGILDDSYRRVMFRMLYALYYPEDNIGFLYEANPIRKVMEGIYTVANKYGLVPDEFMKRTDAKGINISYCNRFLSGLNTYSYDNKHIIRYGRSRNKDSGFVGDSVYSPELSCVTKGIIEYSNAKSHGKFKVMGKEKELFCGYVLQLCHVIKWFGKYLEEHCDKEENKKMCKRIPNQDNE